MLRQAERQQVAQPEAQAPVLLGLPAVPRVLVRQVLVLREQQGRELARGLRVPAQASRQRVRQGQPRVLRVRVLQPQRARRLPPQPRLPRRHLPVALPLWAELSVALRQLVQPLAAGAGEVQAQTRPHHRHPRRTHFHRVRGAALGAGGLI